MLATAPAPVTHQAEFARQLDRLVELGYPALAGISEQQLRDRAEPLRRHLDALPEPGGGAGPIPFVIVAKHAFVPAGEAFTRVTLKGRPAVTVFEPAELDRFAPIEGVDLPTGDIYLCTGIETGPEYRNITPNDALPRILAAGRSPLTIEEGVAVVTQFPGILRERNAFSLAASRCGDRRVPAVWTSEHRPKLGWCWAGNPHTWLGTGSCAGRAGY
ncbi:MAG: hypothetical protein IT303_05125 [Dehalococcoidia bacterium]|nr:hypothetical protein [Dehalococcoidia bacterium]